MMRELQSKRRSLIRFTAIEDAEAEGPRRPLVKPCVKYAAVSVGACLVCASVLAYLLSSRPAEVTESGVAIKADVSNRTYASLTSCQVEDDLKVNCGHPGIVQTECVAKGCCYATSRVPGIPWCFVTKENMNPKCTVPRQDKVNCGYRGIARDACEDRGCCFANAGAQGVPWCFEKPGKVPRPARARKEECAVPSGEKVDCGFTGITESQCFGKGCCYDTSGSSGDPFCFKKWKLVTGQDAKEAEECGAVEADRIECGFDGIPANKCRSRGCCYEPTGHEGVPFCFHRTKRTYHKGDRVVAEECSLPDGERFDCGFPDITPHQCRAKGCCYAPAETTGAPFCFWKGVTEAGPPIRKANKTASSPGPPAKVSRSALVSALLAVAGAGICLGACLVLTRQPPCTGDEPVTRCTRLDPSDPLHATIRDHFLAKWKTTAWPTCETEVPPPTIKEIYEVENESHLCVYEAKQLELEDEAAKPEPGAGPGNEQRCFFGARMKCCFGGAELCTDGACTVCRVIQNGHFGAGAIASAPPGDGDFPGQSYVGGIRFAAWAHTAKGQGLAPGKRPPPMELQDFVGGGAGNAVFVADVLVGCPDVVSEPSAEPLKEGQHSRIADASTGIDEIMIFDEAQAAPRALIVFEE